MADAPQPQLVMRRTLDASLPPLELPAGVTLRTFVDGDEAAWIEIIRASFEWPWTPEDFALRMRGQGAFRAERLFFVCRDGVPSGTATAWHVAGWGDETGVLHMVGVLPAATGERLGYWVSLACLQAMSDDGRTAAVLQTDDFRLPAVKTYLRLGFRPLLVHENQRERWPRVLSASGHEALARDAYFRDGPIVSLS